MALVSPGVQVTIIDQSQYLPAASNSVPLILVASAQNKADGSGTGIASATTSGNANKLYQITSQRDLINLYGSPFFYKTTNGTPIQGYELNEYGLLAAYSLMGITNRAYVLRCNVDMASLVGTIKRPTGNPIDGTYWLDTVSSDWGIFEFNQTTGKFTDMSTIVITDPANLVYGFPNNTLGNIGDYAINAIYDQYADPLLAGQYFYKGIDNQWVKLGSTEWTQLMPTALSSPDYQITAPIAGKQFTINVSDTYTLTVTIPGDGTLASIAETINAMGLGRISARIVNSRLAIFSSDPDPYTYLELDEPGSSAGILTTLGLQMAPYKYFQPVVWYGTSAQQPYWRASQDNPRPSGSVWIKTSVQGGGLNLSLSKFTIGSGVFNKKPVLTYFSPVEAIYNLDPTGGKNIAAGTILASYEFSSDNPGSPMIFYERIATGPTVVTGTVINPTFAAGSSMVVSVTTPNSSAVSSTYTVTIPSVASPNASHFIAAWQVQSIPYTKVAVNSAGQIVLTHTEGGEIILANNPLTDPNNNVQPLIEAAGFKPEINSKVNKGFFARYQNVSANQSSTTGTGTGAIFNIGAIGRHYYIQKTQTDTNVVNGGTGYDVGDRITITGTQLGGTSPTNNLVVEVVALDGATTAIKSVAYVSGACNLGFYASLSNWKKLAYVANEGAPFANPAEKANWFYSVIDQADIMVQQNGTWRGYRNVAYDQNGHPVTASAGIANTTDVNGPIIATDAPSMQSDGKSALVYGDLWLDSNDLENYPALYRWENENDVDQWVKLDNSDQTSSNGILFADARWAGNGYTDPVNDPIPSIASLLYSDYTDLDCPKATLYPQGMLLFNMRRSGYNVKQFRKDVFTAKSFPDSALPVVKNTWMTASGLKSDGSAYMGRKAQRNMVVQAMKASISTNMAIREEDTFFNLIAAPGYPELQPEMVALNNERNNTAYIIGDTPLRLNDQATNLTAWANNTALATSSGEDGLVTRNEYLGIFYPSGIATDLTGASVVVPASHMMLRTFLRNDTIAYPWMAPAGTRRGTIDNATNIGYLDADTGEFQVVKNRVGIRDVLYSNQINPLAYFTGVGLLNYGNKNSKDTMSALDRINVARLVCYIRERLQVVSRPFIFEPNDALTRSQIAGVVQTLFVDLVSKRGLYDYLVVCDSSNNTPARIDRNELWIDIAIEPVKAAEFIYIPVRILNTGEIAALGSKVFG